MQTPRYRLPVLRVAEAGLRVLVPVARVDARHRAEQDENDGDKDDSLLHV